MVDEERRLRQEVAHWLGSKRWQLYLVLTFSHRPRAEAVAKAATGWYREFRMEYPRAFSYASADRGAVTGHWNLHVLLGGLFVTAPPPEPHYTLALSRAREHAKRVWQHGQVVTAAPYDGRRGAVSYVAQYWSDPEIPGMLLGSPIRKSHWSSGRC